MAEDKIFINYRRDDSRADSGRLYDRLVFRFPGKVFRDVASLEPGMEWHEAITRVLGQAGACIVVIGKNWVNITDASGRRRLDDPRDTVRQELLTALERKMRVFPVLVGGARMPQEDELPADLQSLCRRNALEITEQDWDEGFNKLVKALEASLGLRPKPLDGKQLSSQTKTWLFAATGSLAAVIVFAVYTLSDNSSSADTSEQSAITRASGGSFIPSAAVSGEKNAESSNTAGARARLVGSWKANVVELGMPIEIIWHIWPDGTSSYAASSASGNVTLNTTWTYSDGVIYERSSTGAPSSGSITWIDNNNFVLTVIDNGNPGTRGSERRYSRL